MGDELADHGIVVRRHGIAVIDVGVHADARPARGMVLGDGARRGQEGARVLGVDAAFHRVAADDDIVLCIGQALAGGDAQLLLDDVHAGDHFRDRVFHLYAGVHLDEIELAVLVQELEGAGTAVLHALAGLHATRPHGGALLRRDAGRRRLLHHLLVAALHGAVALAQVDGVALTVAQHLEFDVTRGFQELLHVHHVAAEGDCAPRCA
jgi:hypothetical protein